MRDGRCEHARISATGQASDSCSVRGDTITQMLIFSTSMLVMCVFCYIIGELTDGPVR
jgi:hypothetical protein